MLKFISRRILISIPTLIILYTITFFVMHAVPGGPFDSERALTPETQAALEARFHLNGTIVEQYFYNLGQSLQFDFGPSMAYFGSRTVNEIINQSLPVSASLGFLAILFAVFLGIPLGVFAASRKGTAWDFSAMFIAVSGISLPSFLTATVLVLIFSSWLKILPPALYEDWSSLVLPVITLGLRPMSMIARLTRASMLESLQSDFIRTAYAKGLNVKTILYKHALRNSLIPVLTLFGPLVAALISGSFVVESIFALPGLGKYFVSGVIDRDYSLIMGLTFIYGILVIAINLIVDMIYGVVDPRVRPQE